jgi:hypothetical protein
LFLALLERIFSGAKDMIISDEKLQTELLERVLKMQVPLTRAFSMKPTNNDIEYMQSKVRMIMLEIIDSVVFAKSHKMPELVDSYVLDYSVTLGRQLMNLTKSEAWNKNRTIKPKVYSVFINLLEDYALYIYQLTYLATGKEYTFGFNGVDVFNKLCEYFKYDIAVEELNEARMKGEIDFEIYKQKVKELREKMGIPEPEPRDDGFVFREIRFVDSTEGEDKPESE